ncbi:histone-lysine N-methyltransferase SETMAR [Elysia marginata]|uniref:Histone-lysine N-methyltransferase SETMAR n=1 Tax=Elysia marginata TaxID=1093978 RepID=A0AAV4EET5_9GAST|nr:histone-lysine N-methyltransferase SETMAR [Elysia marginata]
MNGVILRWPVPIGTTINTQYYKKMLQDKLRPAIRKKRPGLLESGILFHHDNMPVHMAQAVTDVLAGYKWELLEHPCYSPDLAPCDFHLFPKMKEHPRGQRFETEEDIIQATKVAIKNLDKCSYVTAFKDWLKRIEKCANNGGCMLNRSDFKGNLCQISSSYAFWFLIYGGGKLIYETDLVYSILKFKNQW